MLPREIDEQTFSKSIMGYNTEEVDEFLEKIKADFEQLYAENEEFGKKLPVLIDRVEDYRKDEQFIKSALVSAEKTASEIIEKAEIEATRRASESKIEAEAVLSAAKQKAKQMVDEAEGAVSNRKAELLQEIKNEEYRLHQLKTEVSDFKSNVLNQYKSHILMLDSMPSVPPIMDSEARENAVSKKEEPPEETAVIDQIAERVDEEASKHMLQDNEKDETMDTVSFPPVQVSEQTSWDDDAVEEETERADSAIEKGQTNNDNQAPKPFFEDLNFGISYTPDEDEDDYDDPAPGRRFFRKKR